MGLEPGNVSYQRHATMLLQLSLVVHDDGVARMIRCNLGLAQSAAALHTTSCTLVCNMKTP